MSDTPTHVVVTPPDRYNEEAFEVVLVDFDHYLLEQFFQVIEECKTSITFYVYVPDDIHPQWLIDVASSANMVILNADRHTGNDMLKGKLIGRTNTWYVGRPDLETIWPRGTADPIAQFLIELERYINQEI